MICHELAAETMSAGYPILRRPDAGMRHIDHYASNLPSWRYKLRQQLIPIVRWETPYLAYMQRKLRTPMLDSYFAFTANLGTHTFFMIILPLLFWFGCTSLARAGTHMLAFGVITSGVVKDLLCLPRPLSPPLQRITMSGSAALEYGFPSTHSTNAISVAIYSLWLLGRAEELEPSSKFWLQALCFTYGTSIVLGRLYCGMHGFLDVVLGSILGAVLAGIQIAFGAAFDDWLVHGTSRNPLITTLVMLIIVRLHPEPADDCPCFDDSVAFSGVVIGITIAGYTYPGTTYSVSYPVPGTTPYSYAEIGLVRTIIRVVLGVIAIFLWRATMKPIMFKILPPVFRAFESFGADLPRTFFLKASQYKDVPTLKNDDNVIPSAREIPQLVADVRQRRGRAVSIGPQSAADAYETIAHRQEQRRRSMSKERPELSIPEDVIDADSLLTPSFDLIEITLSKTTSNSSTRSKKMSKKPGPLGLPSVPTPLSSRGQSYDQRGPSFPSLPSPHSGNRDPLTPPITDLDVSLGAVSPIARLPSQTEEFPFYDLAEKRYQEQRKKEEEEIFGKIQRVRVRYDVEVITKLVVYSGIGFLAVQGCPVGFEVLGMGMGVSNR